MPKLLLAVIIFVIVLTVFMLQLQRGKTASEIANSALGITLFTQNCLEGGIEKYLCVTTDSDKYPAGSIRDEKGINWDGCPVGDYKYLINYGGCEPNKAIQYAEEIAYCCTKNEP